MKTAFSLLLHLILLSTLNATNILAIFNHGDKNHQTLVDPLFRNLIKEGYNFTVISAFPLKENLVNYTHIHLEKLLPDQNERQELYFKSLTHLGDFWSDLELTRIQTEMLLEHPKVAELANSDTKFDVIIMDWCMNYALLIYTHIFKAPVILISSSGTLAVSTLMGNPSPPSFIPNNFFPLSPKNLLDRIVNTLHYIVMEFVHKTNIKYHESLLQRYFEDAPSFEVLQENIALVLSNAHFTIESPRAYLPNVIPVAGLHIVSEGNLAGNILEFCDSAVEGFVYLNWNRNFGAEFQSLVLFENALRKIKYKVLWATTNRVARKIVGDNVLIFEDDFGQHFKILDHPNLKAIITDGNLMHLIDAIYYAVPIIGIPLFRDQKSNIAHAAMEGFAIEIDLFETSDDKFIKTVREIATNHKYKEAIKRRSVLLKEQPQAPINLAKFWIKHVIKHKGANHLKNEGRQLSWYQYHSIDALIVVLVTICLIAFLIRFSCKFVLSMFFYKDKIE